MSRPAGSQTTLTDPATSTPSFTADATGDYLIQLIVTDSLGAHSAPATVTVSTTNSAPVAEAGPDTANTNIGTTVTLNGAASYDLDGDPITYEWSLILVPSGSTATLSNSTTATPSFVADMRGGYVASLVVRDEFGAASSPDTVTISYENLTPVADAGGNQAVYVNTLVTLDGTGSSDPNGDTLTYTWTITAKPSGSLVGLLNNTSSRPTFRPDVIGSYVVTLLVSDGFLVSQPSPTTVEVTSRQGQLTEILQQAINSINGLPNGSFKHRKLKKL